MPDINNGQPVNAGQNANQEAQQGAQNGSQNGQGQQQQQQNSANHQGAEFDPTKLTPEQLTKVLENQDLWKNPRLAGLLESDKQLKAMQKQQQEAEDKSLVEQKKFEDLAAKKGEQVAQLEAQLQQERQNNALAAILYKEGTVDVAAALKLIDRSAIKVDDNGSVSGLDEAVANLKTSSPYLFGGQEAKPIGSATNNGQGAGDGAPRRFKASEISDPAFYQANRDEILKAARAGLIDREA